jgi:hypothetical protein
MAVTNQTGTHDKMNSLMSNNSPTDIEKHKLQIHYWRDNVSEQQCLYIKPAMLIFPTQYLIKAHSRKKIFILSSTLHKNDYSFYRQLVSG